MFKSIRKVFALLLSGVMMLGVISAPVMAAEDVGIRNSAYELVNGSLSPFGMSLADIPGGGIIKDGVKKYEPTVYDFLIETSTIEEDESAVDVLTYIKENADSAYVDPDAELVPADILITEHTIAVDNGEIESLEDLWIVDESEDGTYDESNQHQLLNTVSAYVLMYDTGEDTDYYVAYAMPAAMDDEFRLVDHSFTTNDTMAIFVTGSIFDEETGLVYVRKDLRNVDVEEGDHPWLLRMQMLYLIDSTDARIDIPVIIDKEFEQDGVSDSGIANGSLTDLWFSVKLTDDESTRYIAKESIKSIKVNGLDVEKDDFDYNRNTGELVVKYQAMVIQSLELELADVSRIPVPLASNQSTFATDWIKSAGTFKFKDTPAAGYTWRFKGNATYYHTAQDGASWEKGLYKPLSESNANNAALWVAVAKGNPSILTSYTSQAIEASSTYYDLNWSFKLTGEKLNVYKYDGSSTSGLYNVPPNDDATGNTWSGTFDGMTMRGASKATEVTVPSGTYGLVCAHAGNSGYTTGVLGNYDFGYGSRSGRDTYPVNTDGYLPSDITVPLQATILRTVKTSARTGVMLLGVATHYIGGGSQAGVGMFVFEYELDGQPGRVELIKGSSNTSVTDGNSRYDYNGVQFRLVDKATNGQTYNVVATVTNGKAVWENVPEGDYIITEVRN